MKHNLFHFAPSELSHSAFWAWVLQSIDAQASTELEAPRKVALELLRLLNAPEPKSPVKVKTEVGIEEGGRLDIQLTDADQLNIVIENKVSAIPNCKQLIRYEKWLQSQGKTAHLAIFSSAFDEDVRHGLPDTWTYFGLVEQMNLLANYRDGHCLLREYYDWIEHAHSERMQCLEDVTSDNPKRVTAALGKPLGQWEMMNFITRGLEGNRSRFTSVGGSPWTQFMFPTKTTGFDELFYRIDNSKHGFYFSLKQYQKPPFPNLNEKLERRDKLRGQWSDACKSGDNVHWEEPRRKGKFESEVAWLLFETNRAVDLAAALPRIHETFIKSLST